MELDVENLVDSGVTITEVEALIAIPVTMKPGNTQRLTIPFEHFTISATCDDHGILQTIKRIAPVTTDTKKITIMKDSAGKTHIQ